MRNVKLSQPEKPTTFIIESILNRMDSRPVHFEGFHLFPVDLSIITGIVSSITTYLVVLVQFQLTEDQFNITSKGDKSKNSGGTSIYAQQN